MDDDVAPKAGPTEASAIRRVILDLAGERGSAKTICPSEAARHIAGSDPKQWRLLMQPVRREAVRLAREGRVEIRRKGKRVDPEAFKGIYRIAILPPEVT